MQKGKRFVVANWKLNPATLAEAKKLFGDLRSALRSIRTVNVAVCPPALYLPELKKLNSGKKIKLGAQDTFWEEKGAYTGEISAGMLKSVGAQVVIVGHSEARAVGDTNERVNKKLRAAFGTELTPILCIGERERDKEGFYLSFIHTELQECLRDVSKQDVANLIIAYEPIWAIGKTARDAMDPNSVHEMVLYIRKVLTGLYSKEAADQVPILYGGSVEPANAGVLMERGEISGFLVGHASLVPHEFAEIVQSAGQPYGTS